MSNEATLSTSGHSKGDKASKLSDSRTNDLNLRQWKALFCRLHVLSNRMKTNTIFYFVAEIADLREVCKW